MSLHPQPPQDHGEGFLTWHAYDPACKAELWSTAYRAPGITILFDPIEWPGNTPQPMGTIEIVKTNDNHDRACESLRRQFHAGITRQPAGFQIVSLPGAGVDEAAFFHPSSGSLVVGDALIHLAPHPLMPLPDKYCTDSTILRTSLKELLKLPIRRIFFAHGAPILQDGLQQIRQLL